MVTAPVYADYLASFPWEQVADFYARLAEVTDYWDFSYSSVSFEPRYFYDETHFRECVGDMALARMFGDESVYIPEDFGAYVTADNVAEHVAQMAQAEPLPLEEYTAQVPVLMYHHISEEGNDSTELSPEAFEARSPPWQRPVTPLCSPRIWPPTSGRARNCRRNPLSSRLTTGT